MFEAFVGMLTVYALLIVIARVTDVVGRIKLSQ
jgi:hypothetical protein